jgi:exopolyphosphatase/guanosine-5'-triphosphate,3'-diphosphate pyrophosphatase
MKNGTLLAAIDLGSNSFRLEICRFNNGILYRSEYIKEAVRQGSGLDEDRNLSLTSMEKGWDCLSRFAERLAGFQSFQVRAVATQTLREARNRHVFLNKGNQILGFPIEVVSGREEARLIYQGVSHLLPISDERRLVIDIGGRSTEFIIGKNKNALMLESYRVGSVASSIKYFPNGELTAIAFQKAEVAAKAVLDEALTVFNPTEWDTAFGSSGTVSAVAEALAQAGMSSEYITMDSLLWLKSQLIRYGHVDKLRLDGMKEDRKAVIGGGLSVLIALMELFDIQKLQVTPGALRHGVMYDLVEREDDTQDIRFLTVNSLRKTFKAEAAQATRVSRIACTFLNQIKEDSGFDLDWTRLINKLDWSAQLHEIGTSISHSDSHKHGAYILDNTDTPGFAQHELHRLSLLVLGHRGKLRKLDVDFNDDSFIFQLICLRLAVILCHARRDPEYLHFKLGISKIVANCFELKMEPLWSQQFPQSNHLLQQEVISWQKTRWQLRLLPLA